jgi:glycosyltransferase involved in cell wall biosynthesis
MESPAAPLHVCLLCHELFGYGSQGGFGRATRMIGAELVRRGHRVTVITRKARWAEERRDEFQMDGMRVRVHSPRRPLSTIALYRDTAPDLFHSQDSSLGTYLAMKAMPATPHIVTFRAPLDAADAAIDRRHNDWGFRGSLMHFLQLDNPVIRAAIRRAPLLYAAAPSVIDKAMRKYRLEVPPQFLPTPIAIPATVEKSSRPTVCFVGRWHRIKQPEHFLELARQFPQVDFIAVGGAPELQRDGELRQRYGGLPNLEMPGPIDQFASDRLSRILGRSWILVNTSLREALPTTFVEAAAHRCAILSYLDADGFATRFGFHIQEGDLAAGLRHLLEDDRWQPLGEAGYRHVRDIYAVDVAMARHLQVYRAALANAH